MTPHTWIKLVGILFIFALCPAGWASTWKGAAASSVESLQGYHHSPGTVEEMKSGHIQINTGENQPRIISLKNSGMWGTPAIKVGDIIDLTFNEQGALVDYHIADAGSDDHLILNGQIAEPLVNSRRTALVRTDDGKELHLEVRPQVRRKMNSLPVGVDAVFMLDDTKAIVDVNFASEEAAQRAGEAFDDKAAFTVAYQNVTGTIVNAFENNRTVIRTDDGDEQEFEVSISMRDKIAGLSKGQSVVLMIDEAHQVADMAVTPTP